MQISYSEVNEFMRMLVADYDRIIPYLWYQLLNSCLSLVENCVVILIKSRSICAHLILQVLYYNVTGSRTDIFKKKKNGSSFYECVASRPIANCKVIMS